MSASSDVVTVILAIPLFVLYAQVKMLGKGSPAGFVVTSTTSWVIAPHNSFGVTELTRLFGIFHESANGSPPIL